MRPFSLTQNSRRGGFILVTVLLISAMMLGTAVAFALFARGEMRRASTEEFASISRSLAVVALGVIEDWLADDVNEYDSPLEILYSEEHPLMLFFGDWTATFYIKPMSGLIPINSVFLPDGVTMKTEFENPWKEFWSRYSDERIGLQVLDFLDTDIESRPGSVERENYPNGKISHLSELIKIEGIDHGMLYKSADAWPPAISDFFTVYGEGTVNINTAPLYVISALDPDIGDNVAAAIDEYRRTNIIESAKDLVKIPGFPMAVQARTANIMAFKSDHFLVKMNITDGNREHNYEIMLSKSGSACRVVEWNE